jgi:hypothetical protein
MVDEKTRQEVRKLLETPQVPELGPGTRPGARPQAEVQAALDKCFGSAKAKAEQAALIRALVLLWHDHLDAAHGIAQEIENATGAFVHGIMHRREPDYGNAAYWFRRVGSHPAFGEIASRAEKMLKAKGEAELARKMVSGGKWDPFAFIDSCEKAAQNSATEQRRNTLRELQAIETEVLLDWIWENEGA